MIVNDIFERAIALVDGITNDGDVDATNTADYLARTPYLVNLFQMELIKSGDLYTKYPIAYKPFKNILSGGDQLSIGEHIATDVIIEATDVARIYYFESDAPVGTVTIEKYNGSWVTMATITLRNSGYGFVRYKGLIGSLAGETKTRIVFSGDYYYRYSNVAFHKEVLNSINRYYGYGEQVNIALPTNLNSIKNVVFQHSNNTHTLSPKYDIEIKGTQTELVIDRDFEGEILVTYIPNPDLISSIEDDIQVDEFSANIIAYMLAEAFMNVEQNDYLAGLFKSKYQQLIAETQYKKPKNVVNTINVYGTV